MVTVTLTLSVPAGTVALMDVLLQEVVAAVVAPNFTVPVPLLAPKPEPLIVTVFPVAPETGLIEVMLGTAAQASKHENIKMRMIPIWSGILILVFFI